MATNRDIITAAFRKLNIVDENEQPSAEQGVQALETLNDMMADMAKDGIRLGWYPQADLNATAPIAAENLRAIKYCLMVELGGDYDIVVPDYVRETARNTLARLAKSAQRYFESDLSGLPSSDAHYGWPCA